MVLCHDLPRAKGSAHDVALTYPALADRLARETGWRVVTGSLRGAGDSDGDFSADGWLDDLGVLMAAEVPAESPRWLVGFGFGGVLALHMAAVDERVKGVACLGASASLDVLTNAPDELLERCRRAGVVEHPGIPGLGRDLGQGALDPAPHPGRRPAQGPAAPGGARQR